MLNEGRVEMSDICIAQDARENVKRIPDFLFGRFYFSVSVESKSDFNTLRLQFLF